MITRNDSCLEGGLTARVLESAIDEFMQGAERLGRLRRYYMGRTDILSRRRGQGLPNNRVAHAFARYIVTVTSGYLVGEKVEYLPGGCDERALEAARQVLMDADAYSVDVENARNAAIFGRGVEMLTQAEDGGIRMFALPPESAFVVYGSSIEHRPLFGVYLTGAQDETGQFTCLKAMACTESELLTFEKRDQWALVEHAPHFFGGVPMVEYWNDENECGDFEWVMPLIDAYDRLQSDRVNDKEQFTDRLLVLTGCTLDMDEEGRPPWLQLRMDKALCLPDGEAKVQYLSAQMDEAGNEILRKSIEGDIHKLALVPDISDAQFAGNVSGEAMKYKLMALEQLTCMKQKWFEEGLRTRLRLIARWLELRGYPKLDAGGVKIAFTRRIVSAD